MGKNGIELEYFITIWNVFKNISMDAGVEKLNTALRPRAGLLFLLFLSRILRLFLLDPAGEDVSFEETVSAAATVSSMSIRLWAAAGTGPL